MYRSVFATALAVSLLPLASLAQTPAAPPAAAQKVYIPGLEQFMNVILIEHNKLWFAGRTHNWALAGYELGEIKEVMSDVQDVVPKFKNLPLAQMLDAVITNEIVDLEKAIEAKDFRKFAAGYDRLNAAVSYTHLTTENGFVVIQRPSRPAFTNQDYRPHK